MSHITAFSSFLVGGTLPVHTQVCVCVPRTQVKVRYGPVKAVLEEWGSQGGQGNVHPGTHIPANLAERMNSSFNERPAVSQKNKVGVN